MVGPLFQKGGDDDHREQIKHDQVAQGEVRKYQEIESSGQHHTNGGQEIIRQDLTRGPGRSPWTRDGGFS